MVKKISSAIGEEERHGLMQLNGQARKNITNKPIRNGKLVIRLVVKLNFLKILNS